jgi:serine O-acetyltransferase
MGDGSVKSARQIGGWRMTRQPGKADNLDRLEANWGLASIVDALRQSREVTNKVRHRGRVRELPSRAVLTTILDALSASLFPTHFGRPDLTDESIDFFVGTSLETALTALAEQVRRSLFFVSDQDDAADTDLRLKATEITRSFATELPAIRALLVSDLLAAFQGDPAATSVSEILLCYPGFNAIIHYRLAHVLHRLGAPFIARLISSIAHSITGIDIHPGAEIGAGFFIDHGTGVVIGETAIIGNHVRLYQAVTLGARRLPADGTGALIKGRDRHPIIEDNVVIYAGATVLGRITVGRDSTIGGNVWLTHSVLPGSVVTQAQTRHGSEESIARQNGHHESPVGASSTAARTEGGLNGD